MVYSEIREDDDDDDDLSNWYTAGNAAKQMSEKSGRQVKPEYLRSLEREGKVRTKALGSRMKLYYKPDVDNYIVEQRGAKVARSQKERAGRKTPAIPSSQE